MDTRQQPKSVSDFMRRGYKRYNKNESDDEWGQLSTSDEQGSLPESIEIWKLNSRRCETCYRKVGRRAPRREIWRISNLKKTRQPMAIKTIQLINTMA